MRRHLFQVEDAVKCKYHFKDHGIRYNQIIPLMFELSTRAVQFLNGINLCFGFVYNIMKLIYPSVVERNFNTLKTRPSVVCDVLLTSFFSIISLWLQMLSECLTLSDNSIIHYRCHKDYSKNIGCTFHVVKMFWRMLVRYANIKGDLTVQNVQSLCLIDRKEKHLSLKKFWHHQIFGNRIFSALCTFHSSIPLYTASYTEG